MSLTSGSPGLIDLLPCQEALPHPGGPRKPSVALALAVSAQRERLGKGPATSQSLACSCAASLTILALSSVSCFCFPTSPGPTGPWLLHWLSVHFTC